jgi:hypothetical protein
MKSAGQLQPDSMLQNFSTNQRMDGMGEREVNSFAKRPR